MQNQIDHNMIAAITSAVMAAMQASNNPAQIIQTATNSVTVAAPTVSQCIEIWLETKPKATLKQKHTYNVVSGRLRVHAEPKLGKFKIDDKALVTAIGKLYNDDPREIVKGALRDLKAAINHWMNLHDVVWPNAVSKAQKLNPQIGKIKARVVEWKPADMIVALNRMESERHFGDTPKRKAIAAVCQFITLTGCRWHEMAAVRHSDINLDNMTIHLRATKGNKERWIRIYPKVVEIIQWCKATFPKSTVLFPDRSLRTVQLPIKRLAAMDGLRFCAHDLRKAHGQALLHFGEDEMKVASQLGHADVDVLRSHYTFMRALPGAAVTPNLDALKAHFGIME